MEVAYHPDAEREVRALATREQVAIAHAVEKLESMGVALSHPHSSQVQGAHDLRELRPRQGRSRWRAFYRRIADVLVIGSIGPEARVDPRGFERAVALAEARLDAVTP